jgi:hypothetical protein
MQRRSFFWYYILEPNRLSRLMDLKFAGAKRGQTKLHLQGKCTAHSQMLIRTGPNYYASEALSSLSRLGLELRQTHRPFGPMLLRNIHGARLF